MNPHYNQNYSKEEVDIVLDKIKNCVGNNTYTIALNENRQEHIDFINEYNIRSNKQKSILLQLKTEDFCHTLQNTKVDVYTKFNVIDMPDGSRTVVISFHKRNKPIDYLFR